MEACQQPQKKQAIFEALDEMTLFNQEFAQLSLDNQKKLFNRFVELDPLSINLIMKSYLDKQAQSGLDDNFKTMQNFFRTTVASLKETLSREKRDALLYHFDNHSYNNEDRVARYALRRSIRQTVSNYDKPFHSLAYEDIKEVFDAILKVETKQIKKMMDIYLFEQTEYGPVNFTKIIDFFEKNKKTGQQLMIDMVELKGKMVRAKQFNYASPFDSKIEVSDTPKPAQLNNNTVGTTAITLEEFKSAYAYNLEFFKNPNSPMQNRLAKLKSIDEVQKYAEEHPDSRTAYILKTLKQ